MVNNKTIFSCLLCLIWCFSNAQKSQNKTTENKYLARHWTVYEGLSQGTNPQMLKDVNGFLWISSNFGLSRFDGSLFKNYYHDPHNKQTISGNRVSGLIEDSLHNIWIGTDLGLSRYDIRADTFKNFPPDNKSDPELHIIPFCATKDKIYTFESDLRIAVYDIHSFKKKNIVTLTSKDSVLSPRSAMFSVFDPGSNSVWIPRGSKTKGGGGLLNISVANGKRQYYGWPCYKNIGHHPHLAEGMRYDSKRNALWLNSPDGLMEFTLVDRKFHYIKALNDLLPKINYQYNVGIGLDIQSRIWVATDSKGILIYNPSDNSVSVPFPNDPVSQLNISVNNAVIHCDRDGMTWCGTWGEKGVYQLIPFSPAIKLFTPNPKAAVNSDNAVVFFAKSKNKKVWISTFHGRLYQFDTQTEELKALDLKKFPGLKYRTIALIIYTNPALGKAIAGSDSGLFLMDMQTQKCQRFIYKDKNSKIVKPTGSELCFRFGDGLIATTVIDNKEYVFTGDYNSAVFREALPVPMSVWDSFTVTDGYHLMFMKQGEGLGNLTFSCRNGKWSRISHIMDSIVWTSVFFNSKDSTYWVAAESKLIHYNKNFKVLRKFNQANGLPDIMITGLIADDSGNIWFHTDRSIHQLNIKTGEISTLTEKDGFEKQSFQPFSMNYKDDNGDIYFPTGGNGSGFDRITPGKYNNAPSSIYFQAIDINQKPLQLATGVNYINELSLRYDENKISIETGIIDYYSKGTSRMRYELEGYGKNESWQYGPTNYTIRFEDLQPGKYLLRVQASNAALQFIGPEKKLRIIISRPWFGTWWFRIVIVAIASFIIISIFRARISKIKNDALIENQLKELEMKALKAQMNPHFIYNALNSIQALVANDKKTEGIRYIGSFSRLLRQVLDNSENNVVSLDKELETIDLYIQLESLRLDMQLQYTKNIPQNIVTEFEKIPPLILQPFVENALWHGLSRKEGKKEIKITVSLKDNWLHCDITDNGIGREKAEELKNNSIVLHQSKGIEITLRRLMDFNGDNSIPPITFVDLYDDDSNPAGTCVTVHIKRKFNIPSD